MFLPGGTAIIHQKNVFDYKKIQSEQLEIKKYTPLSHKL